MTKNSKRELLLALRPRYLKTGKAQKGLILNQFVAATGYHRKYAIHLLKNGPAVVWTLAQIWKACDCICALRLHPFLPEMIEVLERTGELVSEPEVKALLQMSLATIDRNLQPARLSTTKPGSLLKKQIPIRTFPTGILDGNTT